MKRLGAVARWGLTLILLGLALRQVPLREWLPQLGKLRLSWFLAAAASMACIVGVNAWKWHILLRVQKLTPRYSRVLYHYAVGYFFNSFVTGTGDIKRATDMGNEQGNMPRAVASVLAERWTGVIGQMGLACCTVSAVLWHSLSVWPIVTTALLLVIALVAVYMWFENTPDRNLSANSPGWRKWLYRVRLAMSVYKGHRRTWWGCLGLSVIGPLLLVLIHLELAYALGYHPSAWAMLLLVPTISVFAQLPITVNGFGIQDYFMVLLFQGTLTSAQALALSMVFHALRLGVGACGGVLFAINPAPRASLPEPTPNTGTSPTSKIATNPAPNQSTATTPNVATEPAPSTATEKA